MEALSTAQDLSNTITCCEPCIKNVRCRKVFLIITFILVTFDLVTDWINWNQWSEVGGYSAHQAIYIYTTTFLLAASFGTALWTIEIITIVIKLFGIHRMENDDIENHSVERKEFPERQKNDTDSEISSQQRTENTEEQEISDESENGSENLKEDTVEQESRPVEKERP